MAVGSGWQVFVAYINVGCYYLIGLPGGVLMEILFRFGVPVSLQSLRWFFFFFSLNEVFKPLYCLTQNSIGIKLERGICFEQLKFS